MVAAPTIITLRRKAAFALSASPAGVISSGRLNGRNVAATPPASRISAKNRLCSATMLLRLTKLVR